MKYAPLPNTDIEVSTIAMGCWALSGDSTWGPQDEKDSIDAIRAALDVGINFFDTAEMYGGGLSEQMLGRGLAGVRDGAVIASKFNLENSAADDLIATCERSLAYLGTDYIDLYQIHWPSRTVPRDETWAAMEKLRDQGKIRLLAVSNFGIGDLDELLPIGRPVTNQLPYNLLVRAIEYEILPRCASEGIGTLCYSPLQHGLLTGKFATADDFPEGRARSRHFSTDRPQARHGEPGCELQTFTALERIRQVSARLGQPISDIAMAWLLHQPGVTSVLSGIRNPEQARRNVAAAELSLDEETILELATATEGVKRYLGRNPDVWQSESRSRYR